MFHNFSHAMSSLAVVASGQQGEGKKHKRITALLYGKQSKCVEFMDMNSVVYALLKILQLANER